MPASVGPRLVPPSGWHYYERPDDPIRASGPEELVDKITQDRIANQKTIGNPLEDVRRYIEKNFPQHLSAITLPRDQGEPSPDSSLRERVAAWSATRYSLRNSGNEDLVDSDEAERRAKICQACPKNESYQIDCPPCQKALERQTFILRQGKQTETKVETCSLMGHDNTTAVWLPASMLQHSIKYLADAPKECWLHNV